MKKIEPLDWSMLGSQGTIVTSKEIVRKVNELIEAHNQEQDRYYSPEHSLIGRFIETVPLMTQWMYNPKRPGDSLVLFPIKTVDGLFSLEIRKVKK